MSTGSELEDEGEALVVGSGLIAGGISANWIVDSGATSHMCYSRSLFTKYEKLQKPEKVTLGDRRSLDSVVSDEVTYAVAILNQGSCWTCFMFLVCHSTLLVYQRCQRTVELIGLWRIDVRLLTLITR